MKVDHIGYLVKDIDAAEQAFLALGYEVEQPKIFDKYRGIDIIFMVARTYVGGGERVELVSPAVPDSVVSGLMKKYKNSPYHICYVADDFDGDIDDLCQNKGYAQIGEPCIAPAMNKRRVVFLMHPDLGMIELVEKPI